jgi:predicted RNA-binding protein YlxR (DUF448 family)
MGCKQVLPKQEFMRLVRLPSGEVCYDYAQQMHGRGGYVCPESVCLKKAFKGRHARFGLNPKDLGSLVVKMRARLKEEILRTLERGKKMGYVKDYPTDNIYGKEDILLWCHEYAAGDEAMLHKDTGMPEDGDSEALFFSFQGQGAPSKIIMGSCPFLPVLLRDLMILERLSSEVFIS